jgi:NADH-quinone oxidoreductase subunit M
VTRREFFAFGSLAVLCLVLGLLPQPVLDTVAPDVRVLSNIADGARARAAGVPYVSDEPAEALPSIDLNPKGPAGGNKAGKGGKGGNKGGKGGNKGGPKAPMGAEE